MIKEKVYTALTGPPSGAIKVDGLCYSFIGTIPPDGRDLDIPEAYFENCDECLNGISSGMSSSYASSSSAIAILIGLLLENGFNLLLEDGNIILLE